MVKLGLSIGFSAAKIDMPMDAVLRAEAVGFDSVWTFETYGSDALTPLAYVGALTKKLRLGTAIAQAAARTPANLAMAAQTIDAMCGRGRMMVGLGVSGPQIVEGWYGQPWGKPNTRLRDYTAIMKKIWRREGPVSHDGKEIALPYTGPGSIGLGKPLKSVLHGNPDIPVYLGTGTTTNIRMTAEIADGWLAGTKWVPGRETEFIPIIEEGLAKRTDGKVLKDFEIIAQIPVYMSTDVKASLAALKPNIALYVGGMGAKEMNFHKDNMVNRGFKAEAEKIQELYLAGRKDEANDVVPDDYVDAGCLVGDAQRIKERWKPWATSGITGAVFAGPNRPTVEMVDALAQAAR